jgi:hypothetical protein
VQHQLRLSTEQTLPDELPAGARLVVVQVAAPPSS